MKLTVSATSSSVIILGTLMSLIRAQSQCSNICAHNADPGEWDDVNSPAGELAVLIAQGGGCYQASSTGYMCTTISGSGSDRTVVKVCLEQVASNWQSWSRYWWLWSAISCSYGDSVGIMSMTHNPGG